MSRKRSITSAMGTDERIEHIAETDQLSAMMWPWLLTAFDDWGRLDITSLGKIRLEIFPAFPRIKNATIQKAITAFVGAGIVHQYIVGERTYLAVRPAKWMKWQTYLNGTKRASAQAPIPAPTDAPWPNTEEDELVAWLTRADERKPFPAVRAVGECLPMSTDIPRHSDLSVPSPSPSPSPRTELSTSSTTARACDLKDPGFASVVNTFSENIHDPTPAEREILVDIYPLAEPDVIIAVIKAAVASGNGKGNARYIETVVRSLSDANITTLAAYQAHERDRADAKKRNTYEPRDRAPPIDALSAKAQQPFKPPKWMEESEHAG